MDLLRVNVGCGATPTAGWLNFDNSPTVRLARLMPALAALRLAGALSEERRRFVAVVDGFGIRPASAMRLPLEDASVEVLYSSHMLEHLQREDADAFLAEAHRVLADGGILRLAVPDIHRFAKEYLEGKKGADWFVGRTCMAYVEPRGLLGRLKSFAVGFRSHAWMYDAESLCGLLQKRGFAQAKSYAPGETSIPNPGNLNLRERVEESVYVEATRPRRFPPGSGHEAPH